MRLRVLKLKISSICFQRPRSKQIGTPMSRRLRDSRLRSSGNRSRLHALQPNRKQWRPKPQVSPPSAMLSSVISLQKRRESVRLRRLQSKLRPLRRN